MVVQAGLLGNGADQTRAVETCARTENVPLGQAALLGDEVCNDVAGIGDVDDDALEAAGHNFRDVVGYLRYREMHFIVTVARSAKLDVADGIDDDVAVRQFFIAGNGIVDTMRHKHNGVHEVLPFADQFIMVDITELDFVGNA